MNSSRHTEAPAGITLGDIYFVLFRHKWKIAILGAAGLMAAAAYYYLRQPPYQSDVKLLVRYISDSRGSSTSDKNSQVTSLLELGDNVLRAEIQILTSFDLFEQVATNIGPDKILTKLGGGSDPIVAASAIAANLKVDGSAGGGVIKLTFSNPDPTVVRPVLNEIIADYLDKHMQVHKSIGISDDLLTEETTQLRLQIRQTDDELRIAKTNAGIISIADSEKSYSEELSRIRRELFQAQQQYAEHQASLKSLPRASLLNVSDHDALKNVPADQLTSYHEISAHLAFLKQRQDDNLYRQGYTEGNKLVAETRDQIAETEKAKTDLESKYPVLAELAAPTPVSTPNPPSATDSTFESVSLPVRIQTLKEQLAQVQSEAAALEEAESKIGDLERKKEVQEGYYKEYFTSLEQRKIDDTMGPGRVSGINAIQTPGPIYKDYDKFHRTVSSLALGGFFIGLGWAFLIEFFLDRTIKRPIEIQTKLKIPFFLSIPDLGRSRPKRLAAPKRRELQYNGNGNSKPEASPATEGSLEVMARGGDRRFNSYYDALRDRLVVYFESINLTRKPKLVAVTSTHSGSGVSTIAAGLAASLSETGDGRVLLVDMNLENGAAQQFFQGKPGCKLDDALESDKRVHALVQENLYVVTEDTLGDKLPRALPKRFASLVPKLKASDYDYIIFDMPPVSPISVTARLAGFMDTVMLVIESEKTDQQVVKQANELLLQAKANVTAVLNKTRNYVPERLHKDFLSEI